MGTQKIHLVIFPDTGAISATASLHLDEARAIEEFANQVTTRSSAWTSEFQEDDPTSKQLVDLYFERAREERIPSHMLGRIWALLLLEEPESEKPAMPPREARISIMAARLWWSTYRGALRADQARTCHLEHADCSIAPDGWCSQAILKLNDLDGKGGR